MSIPITSNFDLNAQLPLDARYTVADTTARDAIPAIQRYDGMMVYCISNNVTYQLQGGITNDKWTAVLYAGGDAWLDNGTYLYPSNSNYNVKIGFDAGTGQPYFQGGADVGGNGIDTVYSSGFATGVDANGGSLILNLGSPTGAGSYGNVQFWRGTQDDHYLDITYAQSTRDSVTFQAFGASAGIGAGTDVYIKAANGDGGLGGRVVLQAGQSVSPSWIDASDIYLSHSYTNMNGTNRDGRVYITSNAGVTQPSIQMWCGGNGGVISGYQDNSGTETSLMLMGAPAYPGSGHNGKPLYLYAGAGDGAGSDGTIKFGNVARSDLSYYTEFIGLEMDFDQTGRQTYVYANSSSGYDGIGLSFLSAPGADVSASKKGGDFKFFVGSGVNGGDNGKFAWGQSDGSTDTEVLSASVDISGSNGPEFLFMGSIPTTNRNGYTVGITGQQGYDSGATARSGGSLVLGAGKGINGGDDGIIVMLHQISDSTQPISGLKYEYASSVLSVIPAPQSLLSPYASPANGYGVTITSGPGEAGDVYTPAYLIGETVTTPWGVVWTAVTNGSFKITIDGTERSITGLDFSGQIDYDGAATVVQTAIRTATGALETVVWNAGTSKFTISSVNATGASDISQASPAGSGTDISGSGYMNIADDATVFPAVYSGPGVGGDGGALRLYGGDAAGTGNNDGGDVYISGGQPTGSGAKGTVYIDGLSATIASFKFPWDADGYIQFEAYPTPANANGHHMYIYGQAANDAGAGGDGGNVVISGGAYVGGGHKDGIVIIGSLGGSPTQTYDQNSLWVQHDLEVGDDLYVVGDFRNGSDSLDAEWADCKAVVTLGDTGYTFSGAYKAAIVGEASAQTAGIDAIGVFGVGSTYSTTYEGIGVFGRGVASNTSDTQAAVGVTASSISMHAGGNNIAISANAQNGAKNYSWYSVYGTMWNKSQAMFGLLALDTDFPYAEVTATNGNTGVASTDLQNYSIGLVGECAANNTDARVAVGVAGVGLTYGTYYSYGLYGKSVVYNTADTGDAIAVFGKSADTHAGGNNYGLKTYAASGAINYGVYSEAVGTGYCFYGADGDMHIADGDFYLNGKTTYEPSTVTQLGNSANLTVTKSVMRIKANTTADVTGCGFANGPADRDMLALIVGTSDTELVTFTTGTINLAGGVDFTMGAGDTLLILWSHDDSQWYEVSRSDN